MAPRILPYACLTALVAAMPASQAMAEEDIEYVAEHLAEVPMDNRFATLPVWGGAREAGKRWSFSGQAGFAKTTTGELSARGPMLSFGVDRAVGSRWSVGGFAFYDRLDLSGDNDRRPLQTTFTNETPFGRPVAAQFDHLDGAFEHAGIGVDASVSLDLGSLGAARAVGGLLWQQVTLSDYRFDYRLLEGPDAGLEGHIDFDATYDHLTPFIGIELPHEGTHWTLSPHVLAAWPNPRRGVVGHITGPGFDLAGDTESAGHGAHFGDPSITIGFDVTCVPAHLTIDVGTLVTQALLEPVVHKGIDSNWVLSADWRF
jgi:hypothetical protein